MTSRLAALSIFGSAALLMSACIITTSDDTEETNATTTTTTTEQGGGGTGVGGGAGGEVVTGGGGAGGETSTGGAGGAASCVPETGNGTTVTACDSMAVTPTTHGGYAALCGTSFDQDTPGYLWCVRAFDLYTAGQAEDVQQCIAQIEVADGCNEDMVLACLSAMYDSACVRESVATACADFATQCDPDPFDTAACASKLNPYSDAGIQEIVDCMNAASVELTCQEAFDGCFTEVSAA